MNTRFEMNRTIVNNDYESAEICNYERYLNGDVKYGDKYIYENQKNDAKRIVELFYNSEIKVVSILKRTKLGMDGLMIEISKLFATHLDENFNLHRDNIFIVTGMSNVLWEEDMKEKIPNCFKKNVFHHGKLEKLQNILKNIKNALIIVDEIDTGDKLYQRMHSIFHNCGILDLKYMKDNNIRFIFVSATSINQIRELSGWGEYHSVYNMSVPDNYIGHKEFLERGIIKEFYPVNSLESCARWVKNDIINNYGSDYRIHIIRTDDENISRLQKICSEHGVDYKNHSCDERIDKNELNNLFKNVLTKHIVIGIKGLYRRSNYIPNKWKLKIGATHERYSKKCDSSVQIQGLPGRMTGYWKNDIMNGHKTGPYRTSVNSIEEYENFYNNPLDETLIYSTPRSNTFVSKNNIRNLEKAEKSCVPIMIVCTKKVNEFKKRGEFINYMKELIKDNNPKYEKLHEFISDKTNKCVRIFKPKIKKGKETDTHILEIQNAFENNIPYEIIGLSDITKTKNNWQMYIDGKNYKVYFIINMV